VLKDPRFCLTLPLWLAMCRERAVPARVAVVWREPLEVARSLQRRDAFPVGYGLRLQGIYLRALQAVLPSDAVFVGYRALLDDAPAALEGLAAALPLDTGVPALERAVRGTLRHQHAEVDSFSLFNERGELDIDAYQAEVAHGRLSANEGGAATGDAWVAKIDWSTGQLCYSTFLGGAAADNAWDVAVDGCGSAYVVGNTGSRDFPTTPRGFDRSWNGAEDGFIARLDTTGSTLENGTYLGGLRNDVIFGVAHRALTGRVHVAGATASSNLPISPLAHDHRYGGNKDAFVARVRVARPPSTSTPDCTTP